MTTPKFDGFAPGTLKTWLDYDCGGGVKINPVVTNQQELHPGSCTHHSFVLIIEANHKIRWSRTKDIRAKRDLKIDIRWLLREFPPPLTMRELITALTKSKWNGRIKATDGIFHFKVSSFKYREIAPGAFNEGDNLEDVIQYLKDSGPVLGSFYPSPSYKPGQNLVYLSDQKKKIIPCPECKRPLTFRHAVCVIGTVLASFDGGYRKCFVYLESDKPEENSTKKDGVCYMTVDSMNSVTIPVL